jgi:ABC-type glycerol-3-phosphate transport system permease component
MMRTIKNLLTSSANTRMHGRRSVFASYSMGIFFLSLILFPFFYVVTLSLMDTKQIQDTPPSLLPDSPYRVTVILDYSTLYAEEPGKIEEYLHQDSPLILMSIPYELDETLGYIEAIGVIDGKAIFRTGEYVRELELIRNLGAYKSTAISRAALLRTDFRGVKLYEEFNREVDFEVNLAGMDHVKIPTSRDTSPFSEEISRFLNENYRVNGTITTIYSEQDFWLTLHNYTTYNDRLKASYGEEAGTSYLVENYGFFQFFVNTVIVVVFAIACQLTITPLTAYPLSRLFPKKVTDVFQLFFLGTTFIPFVVIMIPQFQMFQSLGMYNNYAGLLIPHLLPFGFYVVLYKTFFDRIPNELIDAARIDGAGEFTIFTRIVVPLSSPIFVVVAIYTFLSNVVDFFWAWLIVRDVKLWTMNVALYNISRTSHTSIPMDFLMGATVFTIIPVILITLLLSTKIQSVAMNSGLKG